MSRHGDYLYRRNGHFYARLRVPQPLKGVYAKTHLRASLNTSEYGEARLRVLEVVLSWKRTFLRLQAMLNIRKTVAGSALLLGDGLISLESAARESGLPLDQMLREVVNRAVELRIEAGGWVGSAIGADDLDYDHDGSLVLNCIDGLTRTLITGTLFIRTASLALVNGGLFEDCLFFRDAGRRRAVVIPLPGAALPLGSLLLSKQDAEAIRLDIAAKVTPAMLEAAGKQEPPGISSKPLNKYDGMRASELLEEFYKGKWPTWSVATREQMRAMCGAFVELVGNPLLGEIDRVSILRYREQLMRLPNNLPMARRRLGVSSLADLIATGAALPSMSGARADAYVAKIGEAFGWAVRKGFMVQNPALGAVERKKKTKREQDEREEFSLENLQLIFSAPWFVCGRGMRTSLGSYRTFQPHQFWLPILALFTGGRLNELAQLHLVDMRRTPGGTWFADFNLDGSDKIDEPDKRLKTVNSIRQIPLHPELVRLGLPAYVKALADAGYDRLFPELLFDRLKGYGKPAGHWFNERFLGRQLKIPRDGMQTFHSFRHSFISAMYRLDPPLGEFVINQLSGHERGETMSAKRYSKDSGPDVLYGHVERLKFELPTIAVFDINEGLDAVRDALRRKVKT